MKARTIVKWAIGAVAVIALVAVCGVVWLFVAFFMDMEKGERHRRQFQAELDSGRYDFGDQPALFAVAQGIVKNDPDAIRAAAKAVPDLQAPGKDGTTLLDFAVRQSWQHPELVDAVKTLLSLGADPNYTNGHRDSFAMADAGHSSAPILRAMLESKGNPNARDEFGRPMILMNWYLGYYENQARSRLELLLDHGADVNSAMPAEGSDSAGYPLLLYRTAMGLKDNAAYSDSLLLLERGADPNRAGADGMLFGKMLLAHQAHFQQTHKPPPAEFTALWDWTEKHGIVQPSR
ncbi:MAG: ankyrin repeat domain-containing protein [Alphaproteobacteria bacterium]